MNKYLVAGLAGMSLSLAAQAVPLTLTGNFVQVGISDAGTFGSNGANPPGILHDPTGTGNFAPGGTPNDYLTPGTPHDGFAIVSNQTGLVINDNSDPAAQFGPASPTLTVVPGFTNAATWSGTLTDFLNITNTYWFNPNDQIIHISSVLTALTSLTGLAFGRSTDPDPDVNRFDIFDTLNSRGNSTTPPTELVSSAGAVSGLVLGILNENGNALPHNTGISDFCCANDNPNNVLPGYGPVFPGTNSGDFGLQMAWAIGDLATGASVEIRYAYAFGENRETIGLPGIPGTPGTGVPEPSSILLVVVGLLGLGLVPRRRSA